ncbi:g2696 [Coccomyxa viridis]|uniref:G2696 protein n=1 Tax=Coccomyxa viridis TaxID=1274662 RepID=A0ABP1FL11_9CHLO
MAQTSPSRLPRRKPIVPRSSSPVLPTPTHTDLQQEQQSPMPRKRTAAAMLIAEASAPGLLQPISSKRLRKAVGSYRELAGEEMIFEGERAKRAPRTPSQKEAPRRRYTVSRRRSAAPSLPQAASANREDERAQAIGAAWGLIAADCDSDAHKSAATSSEEDAPALAGDTSDDGSWMPDSSAAEALMVFSFTNLLFAPPEDLSEI